MSIEDRIKELGIELPEAPKVLGLYRPALIENGYVYTSGHGPLREDGTFVVGTLGQDLEVEEGFQAARFAGLAMLASVKAAVGDLNRIESLIKTLGLVQSTQEFKAQPGVINGFSELMRDLLGDDAGVGARSAFGVISLPAGWAVEIEAVFRLRD